MQVILRRSRARVLAVVAAATVAGSALAFAQPAHATNPIAPCGAWFHKWQYWTTIWQDEAIRLNGDSVSDLEWYAVGQANDYEDLLHNYNCNVF